MILATRENIYGIDVFTFYDSNRTPFQLTFQESLNGKYIEVCLVNLLGSSDSLYCKYLRKAVCTYIIKYLTEKNRTIFFDMELSDKRSFLLFCKFIRWITSDERIEFNLELTKLNEINYAEFYIKLKKNYEEELEVKF